MTDDTMELEMWLQQGGDPSLPSPRRLQKGDVVGLNCRCHNGNVIVSDPDNGSEFIKVEYPLGGVKSFDWPILLEHVVYEPHLTDAVKHIQKAKESLALSENWRNPKTTDKLEIPESKLKQALSGILWVEAS